LGEFGFAQVEDVVELTDPATVDQTPRGFQDHQPDGCHTHRHGYLAVFAPPQVLLGEGEVRAKERPPPARAPL
jgi:hypothetical protein